MIKCKALGWSSFTTLATLSAPSKTSDKATKCASPMNTCDDSFVQRHVVPLVGRLHQGVQRMNPEANERQTLFHLPVCCFHFDSASFGSTPHASMLHITCGPKPADCQPLFRNVQNQFTRVCEVASFWRMSHKTNPDVDDGFGDQTQACREDTLRRAKSNSIDLLHSEDIL